MILPMTGASHFRAYGLIFHVVLSGEVLGPEEETKMMVEDLPRTLTSPSMMQVSDLWPE